MEVDTYKLTEHDVLESAATSRGHVTMERPHLDYGHMTSDRPPPYDYESNENRPYPDDVIVTQPDPFGTLPNNFTTQQKPYNPQSDAFALVAFLVCFCCLWPLGIVALVCYFKAQSETNPDKAREKVCIAQAFTALSFVGGVIIVFVVLYHIATDEI